MVIEEVQKILDGVTLLYSKDPLMTLCALDKSLYCGPGSPPNQFTKEELDKLKDLGWEFDKDEYAWKFYIGHG